MEASHSENSLQVAPGGVWNDLHPSLSRQIRANLKKTFLIKIRHPASIIEFLVSIVLVFLLWLFYELAKTDVKELKDPEITWLDPSFLSLTVFFAASKDSVPQILLWPKNDHTKYLITPSPYNILGNMVAYMNIEPSYVSSEKELTKKVYATDANAIAIHWKNSEDEDAYINPKIDLYYQSSTFSIDDAVFYSIRTSLAYKLYQIESSKETPDNDYLNKLEAIQNLNFSFVRYRTPRYTEHFDISSSMAIFGLLPIIFSTMPDIQTLFEEKDSRVAGLMLLMGCPETVYWFVAFFTPFVLTLVPYLILGFLLCYTFGMVGTNFGLYLVVMILFIFSEIAFQLWITTFIKKGTSGRALTVVLLIFIFFFAILHMIFTLDENQSSDGIKHLFSIVPFSAFQLFLMSGYTRCINGLPPYTFSTRGDDVIYPPWICLLWLSIDCILYFGLFVLCNTANPRNFGTPIIAWKEFFQKAAWKRAFSKNTHDQILGSNEEFINVHGLMKEYKGSGGKIVKALKGADFYITTGEVIVIIGPNGAGKSTLCNVIAGAIEPDDGYLSILGGEETKRFVELQKYLGICLQENIIINLLSIKEHFELFGAMRGVDPEQLQKSVDFFSEQLQLREMLDNRAGDLSGGQKRKLCIALSLLGDPPLVIMDEPTAGVDVQARQLIWKMIANLKDTTTIVTSHALEEAEGVSSRLFIMSGGKIEFSGTSTELRQKFKCGYLLRVTREDGKTGPIFDLCQKYTAQARISDEREDTIIMPIIDEVGDLLREMESRKEELGLESYSFSVEQLSDMLLKIIDAAETAE